MGCFCWVYFLVFWWECLGLEVGLIYIWAMFVSERLVKCGQARFVLFFSSFGTSGGLIQVEFFGGLF